MGAGRTTEIWQSVFLKYSMLYNRLFDSHDSTSIRSQIGWKQTKYSIYHCGFSVFIGMDLALFVAVSLCRRLALVNKVQQCQKSERVSQSRLLRGGVRLSPQMPNTFGTGRVRFQTFWGSSYITWFGKQRVYVVYRRWWFTKPRAQPQMMSRTMVAISDTVAREMIKGICFGKSVSQGRV